MAAAEVRRLRLWQDRIETEVEIAGSGPPLVYLHGPWGLAPDRAFVARLAGTHTVYAPSFPAPAAAIPRRCMQLDSWLDLVVYYGELFDRLELDRADACRPFVRRAASPPSLPRRRRNRSAGWC